MPKIDKEQLKEDYEKFIAESTLSDLFKIANQRGNRHSFGNDMFKYFQAMKMELDFQNITKGFRQWAKEDITVSKGSKALYVHAPMINEDKEVFGFRLLPVFDICQTDSFEEYKKEMDEKDDLVYQDNYPTCKALKLIALCPEIETERIDLVQGKHRGAYYYKTHKIEYTCGSSAIHELGHYFTYDKERSYAYNELMAEMFSLYMHNKEEIEFKFLYSNIWNNRIKDIDENMDFRMFKSEYKRISAFAEDLLEKLESQTEAVA